MIGILQPEKPSIRTIRAIDSGAIGQRVRWYNNIDAVPQDIKAVFCDVNLFEEWIAADHGGMLPPTVVTSDAIEHHLFQGMVQNPRVAGILPRWETNLRSWEYTFISRRLTNPAQLGPDLGDLLCWGASTLSWKPRSTADLKRVGGQIEDIGHRLGLSRRQSASVSNAAHELLMNAIYDAPLDARGRHKYNMDRSADVVLEPHEVPRLRLTISGDYVALDMEDPNGSLPRHRFFAGIERGLRNKAGVDGAPQIDSSHGGAGLGLFTMFNLSVMLRAEVSPMKRTLVSWLMSRDEKRDRSQSCYFLTDVVIKG